jgi:hypothetical protein
MLAFRLLNSDKRAVCRSFFVLLYCVFSCAVSIQQAAAQCNQLEIPNNGIDEDCDQLDGIFLQLPPYIYMVEGQDFELYFRNCILSTHPWDYHFSVITPLNGQKTGEKWSFTPYANSVGSFPLTLQVLNGAGQVLESKTSTVRISAAAAPIDMSTRNVLLWGHSFFDHGYLPIYISDLTLQPGMNPPVKWLGKRANWLGGPTRYEAKGGTTWAYYLDQYGSPFAYDGQINLRRYFDEVQCYQCAPDLIIAYLDINDYLYSAQLDGSSLANIDAAIDAIYQEKVVPMLAAMKAAAPNAKIAYCMAPAASAHDGAYPQSFGYSVLGNKYRWEKIVNRLLFKTRQQLENREAEGIYLIPTGLDLDVWNEYNTTDALHPHVVNGQLAGRSGYREIGKSIYAWMKYAMGPVTVVPPNTPCNITAQVNQIKCQDQNTPGIEDDTYTFDLNAQGQNVSPLWATNLAGEILMGTYAGTKTFGPYFMKNGALTLTVSDSENANCKTTVSVTPPKPCSFSFAPGSTYCNSIAYAPWEAWMSSVRIGGYEKTSTKAQYNDYTTSPIAVNTQSITQIALTATYSYQAFDEFFTIWVDLNRNGAFEDQTETIYKGYLPKNQGGANVSNTLYGNFQLPRGMGSGYARMRVSMKQAGYAAPCEAYDRGETEDYMLDIKDQAQGIFERVSAETTLKIAPNPSAGIFQVRIPASATPAGKINVQNVLGQAVLELIVEQNQMEIDLQEQTSGIYLLRYEAHGQSPLFYWLVKSE